MTQNANVTAVREFFEAFYAEDPAALDAVLDDGFRAHVPGGRTADAKEWRGMARMIRDAVPDVRTTIEAVVGDGDLVAVRYTTAGTQKGELFGAPATDREITMPGIEIYRVADGRVAECWGQYDMSGVFGTPC